jgi:predicted ATP-grasp superfamily ATP-dependent carboligase
LQANAFRLGGVGGRGEVLAVNLLDDVGASLVEDLVAALEVVEAPSPAMTRRDRASSRSVSYVGWFAAFTYPDPARRWPSRVPDRAYAGLVTDLPDLQDTIIVAAFEGWNDAGDAASDALEHLDVIWEAETIVEIDDEAYYDYQVNRPVIRQIDGVTRELVWPSMRISHCRPPGSDRDIVLMHGVEPNMRWRTFCAELLTIAEKLNVDTVVILGALLADTPHTRPVPVSGAAYSPESAKHFGLEETRYEGPTGIAGVFQDACVAAGIPAVTFWAAVPHYVSQPPNPKATVALLRRVEDVLDIEVPLSDLPIQAEEWEQAVTEMTAEDDEIAEYVQTLEERGDAEVDMTEALGKIDGDALAAEFERYLRRRGPGFRGS